MTDSNGLVYNNQISQTMDIVRPHEDLLIYPIFHFIPGDPNATSAARADGRTDPWVTTPNSDLANQMIDAALASGDLYRIGVSAHGYVDTWAHQNFLGKRDTFNEFGGNALMMLLKEVMAVGHAHAGHQPDWPGLTWTDSRLVASRVVNRQRFMDAASHLFQKFVRHLQPEVSTRRVLASERGVAGCRPRCRTSAADDQTNCPGRSQNRPLSSPAAGRPNTVASKFRATSMANGSAKRSWKITIRSKATPRPTRVHRSSVTSRPLPAISSPTSVART